MKVVSLRVNIAADDDVELKSLKPLIAKLLGDRGTETIDGGRRIHWGTVEVLQGPETTRARTRTSPKRNQANSQGELTT